MPYLLTEFHSAWSRGMCVGNPWLGGLCLHARPRLPPPRRGALPTARQSHCHTFHPWLTDVPDVHAAACKGLVLVHTAFFIIIFSPCSFWFSWFRWPMASWLAHAAVSHRAARGSPASQGGERTGGWRPGFGNQGWAGDFMAPQKKA